MVEWFPLLEIINMRVEEEERSWMQMRGESCAKIPFLKAVKLTDSWDFLCW